MDRQHPLRVGLIGYGTIGQDVFHFTIENVPSRPPTRGARLVAMSIVHILLQPRQTLLIG